MEVGVELRKQLRDAVSSGVLNKYRIYKDFVEPKLVDYIQRRREARQDAVRVLDETAAYLDIMVVIKVFVEEVEGYEKKLESN